MKLTKLALACALTGSLAACGGGSDSSGTQTATFGGTVIDGYIEGATVYLDLNVNQELDSGEPSAVSKTDGTYSLDITGLTAAQIKAAHLFTTVPDTAFDADDAVNGVKKNLKDAGKASFNLMAPAIAFVSDDGKISSAVISPLTTLVSHDMIEGNGKSLLDAEKSVRMSAGLDDGVDLNQDFVAGKKATDPTQKAQAENLHKLAQVVATAIGEVKQAAKNDDSAPTDREALFAALGYLQQNVAALQTALSGGGTGTVSDQVKTALLSPELKPVPATLIDDAKMVTDSSTVDITTILADGFYDGDCLLKTDCGSSNPEYFKTYSATKGTWQGDEYSLSAGQWIKDSTTSSDDSDYRLTANGWAARTDDDSGTYISDGQGGGEATQTGTGERFRISARMVDVAGKTAGSIAGLKIPDSAKDLVFATNSKLFWMQTTSLDDEYRLYTGYQVSVYECTAGAIGSITPVCGEKPLTNISDFINAYTTANAGSNRNYQWSGMHFTFDAGGTSTGGTVSLWTCTVCNSPTGPGTYTKTVEAPYEIKTVSGQQILIIKAQAPENRGEYVMFAANDGKLHGGSYEPAGADQSIDPTFNKAAMNTIMKASGHPDVVD